MLSQKAYTPLYSDWIEVPCRVLQGPAFGPTILGAHVNVIPEIGQYVFC